MESFDFSKTYFLHKNLIFQFEYNNLDRYCILCQSPARHIRFVHYENKPKIVLDVKGTFFRNIWKSKGKLFIFLEQDKNMTYTRLCVSFHFAHRHLVRNRSVLYIQICLTLNFRWENHFNHSWFSTNHPLDGYFYVFVLTLWVLSLYFSRRWRVGVLKLFLPRSYWRIISKCFFLGFHNFDQSESSTEALLSLQINTAHVNFYY